MTLDVELLVLIELLLLLDELVEEVFELPPQLVTNKPKASKDKTFVAFMIFPLIKFKLSYFKNNEFFMVLILSKR